jgi:hypothetical protein
MSNKQSSVEWLIEEIKKDTNIRLRGFDIDKAIEQAKAMHKEEMIDFAMKFMMQNRPVVSFYNETFEQ